MRIQHNVTALNAHRNLSNNTSSLAKNLEKLSSGYRINRAGDDAAGLAISEKMRSQITGLEAAKKNAEDGVSLIKTAEGALTEVHSMLNRVKYLATQSANGTYSTANRAEMQKEVDALVKEIDRIGNTANFNGAKLFNGDTDKIVLHAGETALTFNQFTITFSTVSKTAMTGSIQKMNEDGSIEDTITQVTVDMETNFKVDNADDALKTLSHVDNAIDIISSMRSDFGAMQNRLEHTINNISVQHENITDAEARIRDVDMAKEMMDYTKNNILVQASQAMLSQANQVPQGVLQLLQ